MNRRETESESESVFFSRLQDLADRCRRDCAPDCPMFLDEMQCAAADAFLQRQAELAYQFWGGYEQAERKCCCLYPDFLEFDPAWVGCRCVTIRYSNLQTLEHRDFLGAALGCGLKRETIGDILIEKGKAQLWATDAAAALLVQSKCKYLSEPDMLPDLQTVPAESGSYRVHPVPAILLPENPLPGTGSRWRSEYLSHKTAVSVPVWKSK